MKKLILLLVINSALLIAQIPTNGLVAWYPFNGNANDSSGNGNHGTNNGATLTTDRFGNANSAYTFDGKGNDITSGSSTTLAINMYATISAWIGGNNPTEVVAGLGNAASEYF